MRVDGLRRETLAQQLRERVEQLRVVARRRQGGDQRRRAAVGGHAAQQPHAVALQRQQLDDRPPQVVAARGEQLVLGERVEQRDGRLVVVRALDQVLAAQDLAQLAVQQRRLRGRLGVGLRREQAEHARLAGDAPVGGDLAHADVVHPHAPVHGREPVGLGDDQQVALERALAPVRRQRCDRLRTRELGRVLVGEDAEPRAGHHADALVVDPVLAVAEEDEVLVQQPLQERDRLVDLVVGVAGGAGGRDLDHAAAAVGHRGEVEHGAADVAEHRADRVGERVERRVVQAAVEVEVHHRLARVRLARMQHAADPPFRVALEPDDRVQHALDADVLRDQLGADGVDQERQVLGVGLEHRAGALVAVLGRPSG